MAHIPPPRRSLGTFGVKGAAVPVSPYAPHRPLVGSKAEAPETPPIPEKPPQNLPTGQTPPAPQPVPTPPPQPQPAPTNRGNAPQGESKPTQAPKQPQKVPVSAQKLEWTSPPVVSEQALRSRDEADIMEDVIDWLGANEIQLEQFFANSGGDPREYAQRIATLFATQMVMAGYDPHEVNLVQKAAFDIADDDGNRRAGSGPEQDFTERSWSKKLFGKALKPDEFLNEVTLLSGAPALPDALVTIEKVDRRGVEFQVRKPDELVSCWERLEIDPFTGDKFIYIDLVRARHPGQGTIPRMLLSQATQARERGFDLRARAVSSITSTGEHNMTGAEFWPRLGFNAPVKVLPPALQAAVKLWYPEAESLQDVMLQPEGSQNWKRWIRQGLGFRDGILGIPVKFDPTDNIAVGLLQAWAQRKQRGLATGEKNMADQPKPGEGYFEPDFDEDDDRLLDELWEEMRKKLAREKGEEQPPDEPGQKDEKAFRPTEYTPGLYRGFDKSELPRGSLHDEELENINSEGNVFGVGQVTDRKKPPQESLDSYAEDFPEHRTKELRHLEPKHEFATTQLNLEDALYMHGELAPLDKIKVLQDEINDEDLAEDGKEDNPHITILYGIHSNEPEEVKKIVDEWLLAHPNTPLIAHLGAVSVFPAGTDTAQRGGANYDVLNIDVEGEALRDLNAYLSQRLDHTDTFPEFSPHVTLAYLKPGLSWLYVGEGLEGQLVKFDKLVFSDKYGHTHAIPLTPNCPTCGGGVKSIQGSRGWQCENPPCEWSLFSAGDEGMDMEKYPQPPISDQVPWERAHPDRKEEEVRTYTDSKSIKTSTLTVHLVQLDTISKSATHQNDARIPHGELWINKALTLDEAESELQKYLLPQSS